MRTNWSATLRLPAVQVALVLLLGLSLRLYRVTNPVADWHSFRQADTASVTREYVKHGIDLLRPTYLDHSNIQTGKDNPVGYRLVEFPLLNGVVAWLVRTWPALPLVLTSRLFSIALSLVAIGALYGLVKQLADHRLAIWSALVLATLPYAVFYGRVILPEPGLLAFSLLSLWGFVRYLHAPHFKWWLLSAVSLALALLLKPFMAFLAPVFAWLTWQRRGWRSLISWDLGLLAGVGVAPLAGWRWWIQQFPTGIPASDWLFNSNGIRWRPAWFRWLFWERLTKLIWGGVGLGVAATNLLRLPQLKTRQWWQQDWTVYAVWWASIGVYFSVIATGNVQHDYYQVLALPIIAITLARGLITTEQLLQQRWPRLRSQVVPTLGLVVCCSLSWTQISGYFNVNHWEYVTAGQAVDKLTPATARVIAPAFGDTTFLFQTNRTGWPIGFEIPDKISKGATHYVTTSYDDEARMLETQYRTIEKTDLYLLLDLTQPLSASTSATPAAKPANRSVTP